MRPPPDQNGEGNQPDRPERCSRRSCEVGSGQSSSGTRTPSAISADRCRPSVREPTPGEVAVPAQNDEHRPDEAVQQVAGAFRRARCRATVCTVSNASVSSRSARKGTISAQRLRPISTGPPQRRSRRRESTNVQARFRRGGLSKIAIGASRAADRARMTKRAMPSSPCRHLRETRAQNLVSQSGILEDVRVGLNTEPSAEERDVGQHGIATTNEDGGDASRSSASARLRSSGEVGCRPRGANDTIEHDSHGRLQAGSLAPPTLR